jgi:hemolysin activation/secretion protein
MIVLLKRLFLAACLVVVFSLPAHAQLPIQVMEQLPDAAKPAASIPQDEFLYPELEPEPGKYIVPPVVDRPLGDTEGPRIKIDAIELRGAVDRPDKGLSLDDVWKVIEKDRAALPDGYYIGQLQQLANKITDLYRTKGFIVAHAFIPVQTVEDGIVTIQVLEGVLGRILVEGNKKYKPEMLAQPFGSMLGKPLVGDDVESALIRLTDYPGLTSFGVFQPGQQVGDSDLVLKVQEEKPFDLLVSLDNGGNRFTGEYIARVDMGINNMFGQADRLDLSYQHSFDKRLAQYVSFEYSQMIFNEPQYRIEFGAEDGDFDLNERLSGVNGVSSETRQRYFRFRNKFERGRTKNAYWLLEVNRKTARSFQNDNRLARDHLAVISLEYGFDALDIETQSFSNLVVAWNHGENGFLGSMSNKDEKSSRRTGSGDYATSNFDKVTLAYARLATLSPTRSLLFRANIQYTDDPLFGLEQFTMGGPDSVRAYPVSEVTMDRGTFISAEHIWNAPGFADKASPFGSRKWGEIFTVSAFFDWATGERLDPLASEEGSSSLKGWGLGTQLAVPGSFTAKASTAWPIMSSPSPTNKRKPQFFFSLESELF